MHSISAPISLSEKAQITISLAWEILKEKSNFTLSSFVVHIFMLNKILLLITFTEFLFQRFDIVTLFLCIIVLLIELEIFTHKHLYIWLAVLVFTIILDAFVLIDIAPVS